MKPEPLLPARPHSRRQMDRMRRHRVAIFALVWIAIVTAAGLTTYFIAHQGMELQFSLQIKP